MSSLGLLIYIFFNGLFIWLFVLVGVVFAFFFFFLKYRWLVPQFLCSHVLVTLVLLLENLLIPSCLRDTLFPGKMGFFEFFVGPKGVVTGFHSHLFVQASWSTAWSWSMRIYQKHLSDQHKVTKGSILEPISVCFYCSHWLCFSNEMKVAVFQPEREMTFETGNLTALTNEAIWPGRNFNWS